MIILNLPWPPPTNTYYRNWRGRMVLSAEGREYKARVGDIVSEEKKSIVGRINMVLGLFAPNKRKYDIDGRIKAVQDALQDAGVFDDDEQIDGLVVVRGPIVKGGGCKVILVGANE